MLKNGVLVLFVIFIFAPTTFSQKSQSRKYPQKRTHQPVIKQQESIKNSEKAATQPAMSLAEYEQALKEYAAAGDMSGGYHVALQMVSDYPEYWFAYVGVIGFAYKLKFDNETEIDKLRNVIREYQRRRLQRSEYAAVMTLLRQTYEWKSKIALEKGDRGKALAELKSLEMLGDEGSKAFSSYLRMNLYLAGYLSNKSKTDAQNTRDAARALIENQPGLLVFIPEESQATVLAMIYLIKGSMENDLGNYADAVRELELAHSLLPSDEDISKALQVAKTNNRTGGKQWLSIADILNQVESLKQNLPATVPPARSKNK